MQGQTITKDSKLVIHWAHKVIDGMAYVMLGRSECLKDLYIAGKFDPSKIQCNNLAKQECDLLQQREDEMTTSHLYRA